MSGINSLLKYRFTKKTKIQHNGGETSDSSQDTMSSQGDGRVTPDINSDPLVISETPTSQQPKTFSQKENEASVVNGVSKDQPATANAEDQESSGPWLSKKTGSLLHGFNDALLKKKQVKQLSYGRLRLNSDSESSDEEEDGSVGSESPPDSPLSDSNFNAKRKHKDLSFCDSESAGLQPKRRRVKLLSESSTEEQAPTCLESNPDSQSTPSPETLVNSQILKDKLKRLREFFPATTVEKIKAVLADKSSEHDENSEVLILDKERIGDTDGECKSKEPNLDSEAPTQDNQKMMCNLEKLKTKLNRLREAFPASTVEKIKAVLAEKNSDSGGASDVLILDCESTDSFEGKQKKKIMMLSESSTDGTLSSQLSNIDSQLSSSQLTSSQETIPCTEAIEDQVRKLREAFPACTVERIKAVLAEVNYNIGQASEVLVLDPEITDLQKDDLKGKTNGVSKKRIKEAENIEVDDDDDADVGMEDDSDQEETSSERGPVLSFFETATLDELIAMPGCSKKKAEVILKMRPFDSWENLVTKFESNKSYSLITRCWEIIQIREVVIRLMQRCEKISETLGSLVSTMTGQVAVEELEDQLTTQPTNLNPSLQMKPYQLIGLNWLRLMHTQELNGILADEMGLGKTVQAISFLAHLLEEGDEGPHIIIVPSSTVENWLRELTTWCPDLQVVLYYGSQEDRRRLRKEIFYDETTEYNIVLTTYNMTSGSPEDRSLFKTLEFHYAVFDEGHMLKNMTSQRYQHLQKIRAHRRLLLTGTPLQNNLLELMSLLCFVMPDMFVGKTESLKRMFTMITKGDESRGGYEKERIAQAKNIMKPFVLRRLKTDVLSQLPKKEESVEYCPMIPQQQVLYDNLVDTFSKTYLEDEQPVAGAGTGMVMQLRKLANHPLLIRNIFTDEKLKEMSEKIAKEPSHRDRGALPHIIQEDMAVMSDYELHTLCLAYKKYLGEYQLDSEDIERSGKFYFLDGLMAKKKAKGDRMLLFSQFTMILDILEAFVKLKGYKYLRLDGQTAVVDRQQMIDEYNQNEDIFVFLLSTRAGGMGINLTAANVVVIHDIDFNPYNDKQAEDRCHRVGQTRSVEVVKLISKGTVEEGMLSCAKFKLNLEKDITSTGGDDDDDPRDVLSLLKNALGQHLKQEEKDKSVTELKSEKV